MKLYKIKFLLIRNPFVCPLTKYYGTIFKDSHTSLSRITPRFYLNNLHKNLTHPYLGVLIYVLRLFRFEPFKKKNF